MVDRVQVLKRESAALGGDGLDVSPWPAPIEPQEDAIESAGLFVQDASNRDENVSITRAGDDMSFTDVSNPSYLLSNLAVLIGRTGGQTLAGDTASGGDLTLTSTLHATKGSILLGGSSVFDEANNKLGIGTSTVPHGGGAGQVAIDGPTPYMQFTISTEDDYPALSVVPGSHDSVGIYFDCYFDGSIKSSDLGSNFILGKQLDFFGVQYAAGVAQGGSPTMTVAWGTHKLGLTFFGPVNPATQVPDTLLHLYYTEPDITYDASGGGDKFKLGNSGGKFRLRNVTDARDDITVDGDGLVGIGTDTPGKKLHVRLSDTGGSYSGNTPMVLERAGHCNLQIIANATNSGSVEFTNSADTNFGKLVYAHNTQAMEFWTADVRQVVIDSTGRMGIDLGAGNPSYTLEVGGEVNAESLSVLADQSLGETADDETTVAQFQDTFLDGASLHNFYVKTRRITTAATQTWHRSAVRLERNIDDHALAQSWMEFRSPSDTTSDNAIAFGEGGGAGTEWMVIDNGLVGIGEASPQKKLHVFDITANQLATLESGDSTAQIGFVDNNTTADSYVRVGCTGDDLNLIAGDAIRVTVKDDGDVGIGYQEPGARLAVRQDSATAYDDTDDAGQAAAAGTVLVENWDNTTESFAQLVFRNGSSGVSVSRIASIRQGSATADLAFMTEHSNTKAEKMRLTSDGQLGVGTDAPESDFHVQKSAVRAPAGGVTATLEHDANCVLNILSGNAADQHGGIWFGDVDSATTGRFEYHQDDNHFEWWTNATARMWLDVVGRLGLGTASVPQVLLHVQGGNATRIRIDDTSVGNDALSQDMSGLELPASGMSATSKYCGAVKFMSTDANLGGTLPKFLAGVIGRATETYAASTDGGMAVDILASPIDPGVDSVPSVVASFYAQGGTSTKQNLELTGAIVVDASINTPPAGTIEWDGTNFRGWTGAAWVNIDNLGALSATGLPAADELAIWVNSNTVTGGGNLTFDGTELRIGHATNPAQIRMVPTAGNSDPSSRIYLLENDEGYGGFLRYDGASNFFHIGTRNASVDTPVLTINRGTFHTGVGVTTPKATLHVYEVDESTTQTDITQAVAAAGLLIGSPGATLNYTPGVFWSRGGVPTKPTAGIYTFNDSGAGTRMHFGTSNSWATGITSPNALVISASGQIGINETDPDQPLHITSATVDSRIRIESSGGYCDIGPSNSAYIHFVKTGHTSGFYFNDRIVIGDGELQAYSSNDLKFWTTSQRMTIKNTTGRVGIGTDGPLGELHLHSGVSTDTSLWLTPSTSGRDATVYLCEISTGVTGGFVQYEGSSNELRLGGRVSSVNTPYLVINSDDPSVAIGDFPQPIPGVHLRIPDSSPILRMEATSTPTVLSQSMPGVELVIYTTADNNYTPAVKFMSDDSNLGGVTPKFTAGVAGRATETYNSSGDAGMGVAILASRLGKGSGSVPSVVAMFHEQGTNSDQNLELTGSLVVGASIGTPPAGTLEWDGANFRGYTGSGWVPFGTVYGDVSKVGTTVDNQIGVWTGDGTIEGTADFTWTGSNFYVSNTGDVTLEMDTKNGTVNRTSEVLLRGDGDGQAEVFGQLSLYNYYGFKNLYVRGVQRDAVSGHTYLELNGGGGESLVFNYLNRIGFGTLDPSDAIHLEDVGKIRVDIGTGGSTSLGLLLHGDDGVGIELSTSGTKTTFIDFGGAKLSFNETSDYLLFQNTATGNYLRLAGNQLGIGGAAPSGVTMYSKVTSGNSVLRLETSVGYSDIICTGQLELHSGVGTAYNKDANIKFKISNTAAIPMVLYADKHVRIGHTSNTSPNGVVLLVGETAPVSVADRDLDSNELLLFNSTNAGMTIMSGTTGYSTIAFGDATADPHSMLRFYNSTYTLQNKYFGSTADTDALTIKGSASTHAESSVQIRRRGTYSQVSTGNLLEVIGYQVPTLIFAQNTTDIDTGIKVQGASNRVTALELTDGTTPTGLDFDSQNSRLEMHYNSTARLTVNASGVYIGPLAGGATQALDVNDDTIRIRSSKTPATSGSAGTAGQIAWDSSYIYVCTATNTWRRVAIGGLW